MDNPGPASRACCKGKEVTLQSWAYCLGIVWKQLIYLNKYDDLFHSVPLKGGHFFLHKQKLSSLAHAYTLSPASASLNSGFRISSHRRRCNLAIFTKRNAKTTFLHTDEWCDSSLRLLFLNWTTFIHSSCAFACKIGIPFTWGIIRIKYFILKGLRGKQSFCQICMCLKLVLTNYYGYILKPLDLFPNKNTFKSILECRKSNVLIFLAKISILYLLRYLYLSQCFYYVKGPKMALKWVDLYLPLRKHFHIGIN